MNWDDKYLIQFLQNVFSVKNVKKGNCVRKQIKLLGIKVKFKDKCKTLFNTCSELQNTCNELWDKMNRMDRRMNIMNIKIRYLEYQKKREIVLEKLRKEKRKLRVCFLVSENEKWNAQTLYDAMEKSENFYPFVVVTEKSDATRSLQHHIKFFKNCCKNVEIGFDERTNRSIDLKSFNPDIIFYQQPWYIHENQSPVHMLDCALSYYFSYSIGDVPTNLQKHPKDFYPALQKYFVFSEEDKNQCVDICDCLDLNTSVVGHPKLDVYNNYEEKDFSKKYVIYAPHHSLDDFSLHYSTFDWNGKYILEWAKSHPELNWVFKPHPQLRRILLYTNLMTKDEIERYYQAWADLGIYYDDGNYFDLFKNSKCLITDCGSFLTEYFPTKNPVIHLRNPKGTDYSATNKIIMQTYYDTWDIGQLRSYLDDILLNGNDPKREERLSLLKKLKIGQDSSTDKIVRELKRDVGRF